jgi:hypothetical protein
MIEIAHDSRAAASLLARKLGKTTAYWLRFLKKDRASCRAGRMSVIPFSTTAQGPVYDEAALYRYVHHLRPRLAKVKRRNRFWCNACIRASFEHEGRLGIALNGVGIKPSGTWLTGAEAAALALDILSKVRAIAGRKVDLDTNIVVSDPTEVRISDAEFASERVGNGHRSALDPADDADIALLLDVVTEEGIRDGEDA